ncbi:MAG: response regulator [bacterium]|nr:response regulator [bacterium]
MAERSVLIVEDDLNIGKLMQNLLIGHDITTEVVTDGLMALERLRQVTPSLVILDLALPLVDGWEVLNTLRHAGRGVPVIIVTAHGQGEGANRALAAGADRFFEKPFEPTQLIEAVFELLASTNGSKPAIQD